MVIQYNFIQDYNFTKLSNMVEDKLETLLLPIMNKLMTLHQPGMTASHPASSCSEIFNFNPHTRTPSGYYWLEASNGSTIRVYCNMTLSCKGVGGGWMQVAKLDMTNSSHQCPPGTTLRAFPSASMWEGYYQCWVFFNYVWHSWHKVQSSVWESCYISG